MVFSIEDIPFRKLDMFNSSIGIKGLFIEINLRESQVASPRNIQAPLSFKACLLWSCWESPRFLLG